MVCCSVVSLGRGLDGSERVVEADSEHSEFEDESLCRGGHPLAALLQRLAVGGLVHHESPAPAPALDDAVVLEFSVAARDRARRQVECGSELSNRGQLAAGLESSYRGHHRQLCTQLFVHRDAGARLKPDHKPPLEPPLVAVADDRGAFGVCHNDYCTNTNYRIQA